MIESHDHAILLNILLNLICRERSTRGRIRDGYIDPVNVQCSREQDTLKREVSRSMALRSGCRSSISIAFVIEGVTKMDAMNK